MHIPFNKIHIAGKEAYFISQSVISGKISGDGIFTKRCHDFFKNRFGFKKCLLTTSCTDALEMAAILIDIKAGDEVIMPSYTFVSTANAFALRGAKIIFCDSRKDHPGMDEDLIESLITERTKAIVPVHYAGVACDMDKIMELADKHSLFVIEDAALSIDSYYTGKDGIKRPLGSIGHLAAFSFHETKNIISGEGGMIVVNDDRFWERAEIIREKGTNRSQFFRGEINKYGWVDIGSSFLPSDMIAAFLFAQLKSMNDIQKKRKEIWDYYYECLKDLEEMKLLQLPVIPTYATKNGHIFHVVFNNIGKRTEIIDLLNKQDIHPVFHYLSLHKSQYYTARHDGRELNEADRYTDCLLRLPMFYDLTRDNVNTITAVIKSGFGK